MLHPSTQVAWVDNAIGYGVVATAFIPRGTVVYVKCALDIRIPLGDPRLRDRSLAPQIKKYSYTEADGTRVLAWDGSKFVNHSNNPNMISSAYDMEIAIRDIEAGDEITDDYGLLNIEEPFAPLGAGPERTHVRPDDILRYGDYWDSLVEPVLREDFAVVEQPLLPYLNPRVRRDLLAFVSGRIKLRSVRTLYYPGGWNQKHKIVAPTNGLANGEANGQAKGKLRRDKAA